MLFVFAFLLFVDLLGVSGRIGPLGMIVFSAGLASFVGRWLYSQVDGVRRWTPRATAVLALVAVAAFLGIEGTAHSRELGLVKNLPAAAQGAPNVVVIVVDTLRADHLSSYGYSRPTSPFLEQMSQQGTQFQDAISPSSWTLPAHQSILSGRYPHEHGQVREQMVNQSLPSLGRALGSAGISDWRHFPPIRISSVAEPGLPRAFSTSKIIFIPPATWFIGHSGDGCSFEPTWPNCWASTSCRDERRRPM